MTSLSEVAPKARAGIKYAAFTLVFLIVGRVILTAAVAYWKQLHPPPPPPPDVKFGKLPKLEFPQADQPKLTYSLQTATGGLPTTIPGQFKVFFMPIKKPSLLAYDNAKSVANRLDFIQDPKKLSDTDYRWDSSSPVPSSLTMNIITGAFVMDRTWQNDPSYLVPTLYYTDSQAVDRTFNLLSTVDLLPDDIKTGTNTIGYLKGDKGQLVSAVSLSQSDFIQVNLYRQEVDNTPCVYPWTTRGPITAILALQREDGKQFIHLDYDYFPVDTSTSAVYPLITPADAYARLQNGQSFIAAVKPSATSVTITDVSLAYYDSDTPQQYLQPVYVFKGDNDFEAYVPAVSDSWVQ